MPELGGTLGHEQFCNTLGKHHLGQVLDVVPNHMSIAHSGNRWWWDVLENGPSSRYAAYFDVDWEPQEQKLHNRVLMPILGDHYGRAIEARKFRWSAMAARFKCTMRSYFAAGTAHDSTTFYRPPANALIPMSLAFAADIAGIYRPADRIDRRSVNRRHRDKEILRRMLKQELRGASRLGRGGRQSILATSIDSQLSSWTSCWSGKTIGWPSGGLAKQDLDYRRFFDINTLVGLRMEDERVFDDTHALMLHWLKHGVMDGLRIDHPDGLRDPQQYFERLASTAVATAWIVAEKILMPDERLPEDVADRRNDGLRFSESGAAVVYRSAEARRR